VGINSGSQPEPAGGAADFRGTGRRPRLCRGRARPWAADRAEPGYPDDTHLPPNPPPAEGAVLVMCAVVVTRWRGQGWERGRAGGNDLPAAYPAGLGGWGWEFLNSSDARRGGGRTTRRSLRSRPIASGAGYSPPRASPNISPLLRRARAQRATRYIRRRDTRHPSALLAGCPG